MAHPEWYNLAVAELGVEEGSGPANNKRVVAYFADAGFPEVTKDSVAWCAAFVGAILKRAGMRNSGSLAARSYLNVGTKVTKPKIGDIAVFSRGDPKSWEGHVGFFFNETPTRVQVLGGNQSNKVSIQSYPKSRLLGYRRPVPIHEPEPVVVAENKPLVIPAADPPKDAPKKSIPKAIKESPSLRMQVMSVVMLIGGAITDGFNTVFDTLWSGLSFIPVVGSEVSQFMAPAEQVAGSLQIPWAKISLWFAVFCIIACTIRQLPRKRAGQ